MSANDASEIGQATPETPEDVARQVLDTMDRSGYGTDREDRWTPVFHVEDVVTLALEVLRGR